MASLLIGTIFVLIVEAVAYLYAAARLWPRVTDRELRPGWIAFMVWWIGTAGASLLTAMRHGVYLGTDPDPAADVGLLVLALGISYAGTAGLLIYLGTLLFGHRRWFWTAYLMEAMMLVLTAYAFIAAEPLRLYENGATLATEYAHPISALAAVPAIPNALLPLGMLVALAIRARHADPATAGRARWISGLLAAWIVGKAIISSGGLGWAPPAVTWAMRGLAILAALGLVRVALAPRAVGVPRSRGNGQPT